MPKKKKEELEELEEVTPQMAEISHNYNRVDLNDMRDRVNELIRERNDRV